MENPQPSSDCWPDKLMERADVLSAEDQEALREHMKICSKCADLYAEHQSVLADLRHFTATLDVPDMLPHLLEVRRQHELEDEERAARKEAFLRALRPLWDNPVVKQLSSVGKAQLLWGSLLVQILAPLRNALLRVFGVKSAYTTTSSTTNSLSVGHSHSSGCDCKCDDDSAQSFHQREQEKRFGGESALFPDAFRDIDERPPVELFESSLQMDVPRPFPSSIPEDTPEIDTPTLSDLPSGLTPEFLQKLRERWENQEPRKYIGDASSRRRVEVRIVVLCPDEKVAESLLREPEGSELYIKERVEQPLQRILGEEMRIVEVSVRSLEGQDRNEELPIPTPQRPVRAIVVTTA